MLVAPWHWLPAFYHCLQQNHMSIMCDVGYQIELILLYHLNCLDLLSYCLLYI